MEGKEGWKGVVMVSTQEDMVPRYGYHGNQVPGGRVKPASQPMSLMPCVVIYNFIFRQL